MAEPHTHILDTLSVIISNRKGGNPSTSYTAKLFAKGRQKIAQKVGEEGVETAIAAVSEMPGAVVSESADLLYHLLVLWADSGIAPSQVWDELQRRVGVSGLDERKSRKK